MSCLLCMYSRRSWAARLGIGFIIAGMLVACAPSQPAPEAPSPTTAAPAIAPTIAPVTTPIALSPTESARPSPIPDFLALPTRARGYLTTPNELRRIAALARSGAEPYQAAVKAELGYAKDALGRDVPRVPDT